jgi:hypothetical protein
VGTAHAEVQRRIEASEGRDRLHYSRNDSVKQSDTIAAKAERREIGAISDCVEDHVFL